MALSAACEPAGAFECATVEDCVALDAGLGVCQPTGYCSFTDIACASGQRYGEYASDRLANACVPPEDAREPDEDDDSPDPTGGTTGIDPDGGSDSDEPGNSGPDSDSGSGSGTDDTPVLDPNLGLWVTF